MRYCGGLRIDHAMGLMRLWLVPHGAPPSEGAYVACPFDDLLRLLALESYRNGAIVIGEDLGTVPPGFRRRCRDAGIAGMDVLWFQRDGTHFLSPGEWRDDAVAMTTTHDLPTVAGWWQGADLDLRRDLGLAHETEVAQRQADRASLWQAFTAAGSTRDSPPPVDQAAAAVDTAVAYVARTSSPLTLLPIEDAMGLIEQPNLPGTTDEQPNWRRRLDLPASELLRQPAASCRVDLLARRKR
jgi:4-alpha-glucanotransferase